MAFLAAPEVAAEAAAGSAQAAGAVNAAKGAKSAKSAASAKGAKSAAKRKAPSSAPSSAPADRSTPSDSDGQGDADRGPNAWSRAGDTSKTIVAVQAPQPIETGAGFLLGLIAWAIVINLLRGGPAQAKGWILAKLINKPYGGKAGSNVQAPARPEGPVTA